MLCTILFKLMVHNCNLKQDIHKRNHGWTDRPLSVWRKHWPTNSGLIFIWYPWKTVNSIHIAILQSTQLDVESRFYPCLPNSWKHTFFSSSLEALRSGCALTWGEHVSHTGCSSSALGCKASIPQARSLEIGPDSWPSNALQRPHWATTSCSMLPGSQDLLGSARFKQQATLRSALPQGS